MQSEDFLESAREDTKRFKASLLATAQFGLTRSPNVKKTNLHFYPINDFRNPSSRSHLIENTPLSPSYILNGTPYRRNIDGEWPYGRMPTPAYSPIPLSSSTTKTPPSSLHPYQETTSADYEFLVKPHLRSPDDQSIERLRSHSHSPIRSSPLMTSSGRMTYRARDDMDIEGVDAGRHGVYRGQHFGLEDASAYTMAYNLNHSNSHANTPDQTLKEDTGSRNKENSWEAGPTTPISSIVSTSHTPDSGKLSQSTLIVPGSGSRIVSPTAAAIKLRQPEFNDHFKKLSEDAIRALNNNNSSVSSYPSDLSVSRATSAVASDADAGFYQEHRGNISRLMSRMAAGSTVHIDGLGNIINSVDAMKLLLLLQQWLVTVWRVRQTQHSHLTSMFAHENRILFDGDMSAISPGSVLVPRRRNEAYSRALLIYSFVSTAHQQQQSTVGTYEDWLQEKFILVTRSQALAEVFRAWAWFAGVGSSAKVNYSHRLLRRGLTQLQDYCKSRNIHRRHLLLNLGARVLTHWPRTLQRSSCPRRLFTSRRGAGEDHPASGTYSRDNGRYSREMLGKSLASSRLHISELDMSRAEARPSRYDDDHGHEAGDNGVRQDIHHRAAASSSGRGRLTVHPFAMRGGEYFSKFLLALGTSTLSAVAAVDDQWPSNKSTMMAASSPHRVGVFSPPPWSRTSLLGSGSVVTRIARSLCFHKSPRKLSPLKGLHAAPGQTPRTTPRTSPGEAIKDGLHSELDAYLDKRGLRKKLPRMVSLDLSSKYKPMFATTPNLQDTALVELQVIVSLAFAFRRLHDRLFVLPKARRLKNHHQKQLISRSWQHWRSELHQTREIERSLGIRMIEAVNVLVRIRVKSAFKCLRRNVKRSYLTRDYVYRLGIAIRSHPAAVQAIYRIKSHILVKTFLYWKTTAAKTGMTTNERRASDSHCRRQEMKRTMASWRKRLAVCRVGRAAIRDAAMVRSEDPWESVPLPGAKERRSGRSTWMSRAEYHAAASDTIRSHNLLRGIWKWRLLLRRTRLYFSVSDVRYSILPLQGLRAEDPAEIAKQRKSARMYRDRSAVIVHRDMGITRPGLGASFTRASGREGLGGFRLTRLGLGAVGPSQARRLGTIHGDTHSCGSDNAMLKLVELNHSSLSLSVSNVTAAQLRLMKPLTATGSTVAPTTPSASVLASKLTRRGRLANISQIKDSSLLPEALQPPSIVGDLASAPICLQYARRWLLWLREHKRLKMVVHAIRADRHRALASSVWLLWLQQVKEHRAWRLTVLRLALRKYQHRMRWKVWCRVAGARRGLLLAATRAMRLWKALIGIHHDDDAISQGRNSTVSRHSKTIARCTSTKEVQTQTQETLLQAFQKPGMENILSFHLRKLGFATNASVVSSSRIEDHRQPAVGSMSSQSAKPQSQHAAGFTAASRDIGVVPRATTREARHDAVDIRMGTPRQIRLGSRTGATRSKGHAGEHVDDEFDAAGYRPQSRPVDASGESMQQYSNTSIDIHASNWHYQRGSRLEENDPGFIPADETSQRTLPSDGSPHVAFGVLGSGSKSRHGVDAVVGETRQHARYSREGHEATSDRRPITRDFGSDAVAIGARWHQRNDAEPVGRSYEPSSREYAGASVASVASTTVARSASTRFSTNQKTTPSRAAGRVVGNVDDEYASRRLSMDDLSGTSGTVPGFSARSEFNSEGEPSRKPQRRLPEPAPEQSHARPRLRGNGQGPQWISQSEVTPRRESSESISTLLATGRFPQLKMLEVMDSCWQFNAIKRGFRCLRNRSMRTHRLKRYLWLKNIGEIEEVARYWRLWSKLHRLWRQLRTKRTKQMLETWKVAIISRKDGRRTKKLFLKRIKARVVARKIISYFWQGSVSMYKCALEKWRTVTRMEANKEQLIQSRHLKLLLRQMFCDWNAMQVACRHRRRRSQCVGLAAVRYNAASLGKFRRQLRRVRFGWTCVLLAMQRLRLNSKESLANKHSTKRIRRGMILLRKRIHFRYFHAVLVDHRQQRLHGRQFIQHMVQWKLHRGLTWWRRRCLHKEGDSHSHAVHSNNADAGRVNAASSNVKVYSTRVHHLHARMNRYPIAERLRHQFVSRLADIIGHKHRHRHAQGRFRHSILHHKPHRPTVKRRHTISISDADHSLGSTGGASDKEGRAGVAGAATGPALIYAPSSVAVGYLSESGTNREMMLMSHLFYQKHSLLRALKNWSRFHKHRQQWTRYESPGKKTANAIRGESALTGSADDAKPRRKSSLTDKLKGGVLVRQYFVEFLEFVKFRHRWNFFNSQRLRRLLWPRVCRCLSTAVLHSKLLQMSGMYFLCKLKRRALRRWRRWMAGVTAYRSDDVVVGVPHIKGRLGVCLFRGFISRTREHCPHNYHRFWLLSWGYRRLRAVALGASDSKNYLRSHIPVKTLQKKFLKHGLVLEASTPSEAKAAGVDGPETVGRRRRVRPMFD